MLGLGMLCLCFYGRRPLLSTCNRSATCPPASPRDLTPGGKTRQAGGSSTTARGESTAKPDTNTCSLPPQQSRAGLHVLHTLARTVAAPRTPSAEEGTHSAILPVLPIPHGCLLAPNTHVLPPLPSPSSHHTGQPGASTAHAGHSSKGKRDAARRREETLIR